MTGDPPATAEGAAQPLASYLPQEERVQQIIAATWSEIVNEVGLRDMTLHQFALYGGAYQYAEEVQRRDEQVARAKRWFFVERNLVDIARLAVEIQPAMYRSAERCFARDTLLKLAALKSRLDRFDADISTHQIRCHLDSRERARHFQGVGR